jgi:hypothetical protein
MSVITINSPASERILALIKVQAAINALKLVDDIKLGSHNIYAAIGDLEIYEKQLLESFN